MVMGPWVTSPRRYRTKSLAWLCPPGPGSAQPPFQLAEGLRTTVGCNWRHPENWNDFSCVQKGAGGQNSVLFASAELDLAVMVTTAPKASCRAPCIWSPEPRSSVEAEGRGSDSRGQGHLWRERITGALSVIAGHRSIVFSGFRLCCGVPRRKKR